MADLGLVEAKLNSLPANLRAPLREIFTIVLKDLRFGHPADLEASKNFGGHFYESETAAIAGDEFTVAHQFGRTPYLVQQVLALDIVGCRMVPLEVTRAADDKRIYLSSTVAGAPVMLYVEG